MTRDPFKVENEAQRKLYSLVRNEPNVNFGAAESSPLVTYKSTKTTIYTN